MLILYLSVFYSLAILHLDCYDYESNESYYDYSQEEPGEINKEPEDEPGPIHTSGISHASEPLHAYIEMCKRKKKTQKFHSDDGITSNSEEPEKHDIYRGFERTEMQSVVEEMSRTSCKPREVCLDVLEEYPFTTNTFYKSRCVAVHRCGGCCNAIHDNCINISFSYITKLLVKYTLPVTEELKIIKATFINHTDCLCKPKSNTRLSFHPRRRRTPVEENKRCIKSNTICLLGQSWDPVNCRCVSLKTKQSLRQWKTGEDPSNVCGPRHTFDEDTCQCICNNGLNLSSCGVNKEIDQASCNCVCRKRKQSGTCRLHKDWNEKKCACTCIRACPRGLFQDPTTCQCKCPDNEVSCIWAGKQFSSQAYGTGHPVKWSKNVYMDLVLVTVFVTAFQMI